MGGPGSGNKAYGFGYNRGHAAGLAQGRAQGAQIGLGRAALVATVAALVVGVGREVLPGAISAVRSKVSRKATSTDETTES